MILLKKKNPPRDLSWKTVKHVQLAPLILTTNTITLIDGHGGGCVGCAHPPKKQKSSNTPPAEGMGGVHPSVKDPAGKKIFDTPVGLFFAIFLQNHTPVY